MFMDGWDLRCGPEECLSDPTLSFQCGTNGQDTRMHDCCQLKAHASLVKRVSEAHVSACKSTVGLLRECRACQGLCVRHKAPPPLLMVNQRLQDYRLAQ